MRFLFYLRYNSTPHVTFSFPGPVVAERRVWWRLNKIAGLWRDLASTAGCDQFHQNTEPCRPVRTINFPEVFSGAEWHKLLSQVKPGAEGHPFTLCVSFIKLETRLSGGLRNGPNNSQNVVLLIEEAWASWSSPEKLVLRLQQKNAPVAEALCDSACLCVWRGGVAQRL